MNKKFYIALILLLIIIFIGTCVFNKKKETVVPKAIEKPKESISYYHQAIILIVDKNWPKDIQDSLLQTDSLQLMKIASENHIIFITSGHDTLEYEKKKINKDFPIIVFHPETGALLTDLNKMDKAKAFLFNNNLHANSIDQPEEHFTSETKDIETLPPSSPTINNTRPIEYLSYLNGHKQSAIGIDEKLDSLPAQIHIELTDRNLFYPLLNNNQQLLIRFDNDFWDYTDYYYTNGAAIGYTHPIFASTPISRLLVSNGSNGFDYYGMQVVQHMYTGEKPKVDSIIPGDRPWASYSTIGLYLKSIDKNHKITHYSEFNIGALGPESGGGFLQNLVHTVLPNNSPPAGWDNQIATDIIIDYQYKIHKALWEAKNTESYIKGAAQVGTLRDNLSWGFGIRYGNFLPFYEDIAIYNRKKHQASFNKKLRFSIVGDIETQLIGYDATLQGGVTNRTSIYVIGSGNMSRFVILGYGGFEASYGRVELLFLQHWKSKEFKTGKDHKYVSIRLNIAF